MPFAISFTPIRTEFKNAILTCCSIQKFEILEESDFEGMVPRENYSEVFIGRGGRFELSFNADHLTLRYRKMPNVKIMGNSLREGDTVALRIDESSLLSIENEEFRIAVFHCLHGGCAPGFCKL